VIARSEVFRGWLGTWFDDVSQDVAGYIEGCEKAPAWLEENRDGFRTFRDELAVHIRESSYPPLPGVSQWATDEWLRDLWFDTFGPEVPSGDPYPVPDADWGTSRLTTYMLHAVDEDDEGASDGAPEWLAARGLTAKGVYDAISSATIRRPEPDDYDERLAQLTEAGLREDSPTDE
jgi:hypothetical protein